MGKWQLHRFFSGDDVIRRHMPPTVEYNSASLKRFLKNYKAVYIKPNDEHQGIGIIKAWKTEQGTYTYVKVRGKPAAVLPTTDALHQKLGIQSKPRFVVQKAIPLARTKGRPFDIRVMMMRHHGKWTYVGMLAKVAGQNSIITNVRRGGGYVETVSAALSSAGQQGIAKKEAQLRELSYRICQRADRYKYSRQIGIDFGIDKKGNIWIIEVNLDYPSHALFAKLRDRKTYHKIKQIAATYKDGWKG
ncbi:YheC/YheD family protein [Paenibacillus herberti]|uniref:ATP-grasp domain-containing protein n=1 Tax=Paenibacillus herberti TaxID=1619309 RepID=A0A229P357_9BACL|nr:YheC/YheD family protein [Paenibacillus herberti]OXM16384.1 hypothetical protein CGZ75_06805 [Paenibacillus herberti]